MMCIFMLSMRKTVSRDFASLDCRKLYLFGLSPGASAALSR
jgi:hypothetical protein